MLYVGHFSFDGIDGENTARHGYFTCLIEAPDADAAVAKFAGHILELKKTEPPLTEMVHVYLEDIIQVEAVPQEPIVTLVQSSRGEFPDSISVSLPGVVKDGIAAYGLPTNVEAHEAEENQGRFLYPKPFVSFDIGASRDE